MPRESEPPLAFQPAWAPYRCLQPARSQGSQVCHYISGLPSRGESMTPLRILDETGKFNYLSSLAISYSFLMIY